MPDTVTDQNAAPGSISTNGQNGSGPAPESRLMELLRQESTSDDSTSIAPPPVSAPDTTETPEQATEPGEPVQTETLPSEDAASPDAEEAEGSASEEQSNDSELNQALEGLNDDARKTLVELAKEIAEGKTSLGKLKQGHRNERKLLERVAELEAKIDGGVDAESPAAIPTANIPTEVAKLKDLNEVRAREHKARQAVRQLERVLRTQPDVEGNFTIEGKTYTAQQIDGAIEGWQDELDAIPQRADQLQQQATIQAQRREFRQVFEKDYPWAKDPDSQQNAAVKEVLKRFPQFKQSVAPEYFAYVWHLGEKAAAAERTGRQTGGLAAKPAANKPAGKVPAGKPHSAASSVPSKASDSGASFNSALSRYKTDRSKDALNTLLSTSGRL